MWPAPRSTARRSNRATFHEESNATMAKFGAGGSLFKLDAICDKLKTNLKSRQETYGAVTPSENHVTENGVDGHVGDFPNSEEPNNNTDGLEKAVSLTNHECSDYDEQNCSRQGQPVHDGAGDPDDQERISPEARRKSRRKSCHPRNISNMTSKRQLAGYEVNNAGIDFSAICRSAMEDEEADEENGDDVGEWQDGQLRIFYRNDDPSIRSDSELSCASHESGAVPEPAFVRAGPDASSDVLDLSMSKPNSAGPARDPEHGGGHYADVPEENGVLNLSLGQRKTPPSGSSGHASPAKEMKEYAEDTMNELLSMYGLTDDGGGSGGGSGILEGASLNAEIFARKRHLVNSQNNSNDSSADSSLLEPILNKRIKMELEEEEDGDLKRSPGRPVDNRISTPGCYAKAVGNQLLQDKSADLLSPTSQTTLPDYCKYLKRFNSYEECRGNHCEDMNYKEHFHCLDCSFRVFVKKEEMIRHFKWHKKRDESLQHGFMRYSPVDDCSKKFPGSCTHNGKQTHYHCLQAGCSKVYISTSDVQMHANYHRKDSAILREGFQRFRATEDCGTPTCSFYNQRTTHFHCRRPGCTFTFKNKADMEKHKTYHQKDEILTKDGFKKFMKYEHCSFPGCRYSKTSNHIHCIRPGCHYVLHSTGQLYSHKRKHERANYDRAYRRLNTDSHGGRPLAVVSQHLLPSGASSQGMFTNTNAIKKEFPDLKDPQTMGRSEMQDAAENSPATSEMSPSSQHNLSMTSLSSAASDPDNAAIASSGGATVKIEPLDGGAAVLEHNKVPYSTIAKLVSKLNHHHPQSDSMTLPMPGQSGVNAAPPPLIGVVPGTPAPISVPGAGVRPPSPTTAVGPGGFVPKVSPPVNEKKERDESWKKFLTRYTANDPCHSRCQFLYKDHYHCNTPNCGLLFRSKDRVREHAKCHEQQERITSLTFMVYEENVSCSENCRYNRKEKHYHCLWADCKHVIGAVSDSVFSRMEHYKQHEDSRAAQGRRVSGSGPMLGTPHGLKRRRGRPPKYQKRELTQVPKIEMTDEEIAEQARLLGADHCIASGFRRFTPSDPCPDDKCIFVGKEHYHCIRQRCHHATDSTELLSLHAKDFHSYIHILEGFEFFDRTVNCRRPHCHNNKATRHFHCVRPNCDYSFVRVSTMAQHDKKHRMAELGMTHSPTVAVPTMAFMANHHQQHGNSNNNNNGGGGGPKALPLVPLSVTQAQQLVTIAHNAVVRATSTYFPSRTTAAPSQSSAMKGAGLVHVSQTAPITVTMPLRQTVSSQAKVALSSVQPIVIAPITTGALPSTGLTSLVPAANPPGLLAVSSAAPPLLLKPLPTGHTEPVMTSAAVSASKTADNGSHFGAQLITIAPKPSPTTVDAEASDKKAAGAAAANSQQGMPLTLLLQQKVPKVIAQTSWVSLLLKMQCSPHLNCGRPFCKLKKKDHFHCFDCNQAFSDPLRLKNHITKHGFHVDKSDMLQGRVVPLSDQLTAASVTQEENVDSSASVSEVEENGGSLNLVPGSFSNLLSTGLDQDNDSDVAMDLSMSSSAKPRSPCPSAKLPSKRLAPETGQDPAEPVGRESVRPEILQSLGLVKRADEGTDAAVPSKRKDDQTKNSDIGKPASELRNQASSAEHANPRPASSSPSPSAPGPTTAAPMDPPAGVPVTSVASDWSAPANAKPTAPGYQKYTYNEDCQFERCAYRQSQSHYHCDQNNCGYAFCDLARFGPHSERHRRLLQLMGDEFEEYRANVDCGRADCEFSKKSSHFHCLRCPFICTDTVKVTAHRKNHAMREAPSD